MTTSPIPPSPEVRAAKPTRSQQGSPPVIKLVSEGDHTSLQLRTPYLVLAQVVDIPNVPVPAIPDELKRLLPPAMHSLSDRAVAATDLETSRLILIFICLTTGLDAPALYLIRRNVQLPADAFAQWLGVTPETLSRWEQGHRPVNPMARRSLLMAFRALAAPHTASSHLLESLPEPPVPLVGPIPTLSFADGTRWLAQLAAPGVTGRPRSSRAHQPTKAAADVTTTG